MKKLIFALTLSSLSSLSSLFSMPAMAEQDNHHQQGQNMPFQGDMMMNHEQMMTMREHMRSAADTMMQLQGETDPEKRQALMQEHLEQMQEGMQMMDMMHEGNDDQLPMPNMMDMLQQRMDMMNENMDMTKMMMDQMQMHESEQRRE
jgi:hypothetical protein